MLLQQRSVVPVPTGRFSTPATATPIPVVALFLAGAKLGVVSVGPAAAQRQSCRYLQLGRDAAEVYRLVDGASEGFRR